MSSSAKRAPAPKVQFVTLAVPPTSNNRLRPGLTDGGKPRLFLSRSTRAYKKLCESFTGRLRPIEMPRPVCVRMDWFRQTPRDGDLDNRLKSVLDVLKGRAYIDDSQIAELHFARHDTEPTRPRISISIEDASP